MCKYVVVDLEMCNVSKIKRMKYPYSKEIIQIGAVLLDEKYNIQGSFETYVKPKYGQIDKFINGLTGINDSHLIGAPTFEEATSAFMNWIPKQDVKIVSWSMSDEIQIRKESKLKNTIVPRFQEMSETWVDAQSLFSEKIESDKVFRLKEALIATDVSAQEVEHNAVADAENTAMLFAKMQREEQLLLNIYYENVLKDVDTEFGVSMMEVLSGFQGCSFAIG